MVNAPRTVRLIELERKVGLAFPEKASADEMKEYCALFNEWVESSRPRMGDMVPCVEVRGEALFRSYLLWQMPNPEKRLAAGA